MLGQLPLSIAAASLELGDARMVYLNARRIPSVPAKIGF
jgi:hypothetical protein